MYIHLIQFNWDIGNLTKCQKHGLTRAGIEFALSHNARFAADPDHSLTEQRFIAVSRTAEGRSVFVAFCWRDEKLRPISARYMHQKEALRHAL